jgi:hypothetical protein
MQNDKYDNFGNGRTQRTSVVETELNQIQLTNTFSENFIFWKGYQENQEEFSENYKSMEKGARFIY